MTTRATRLAVTIATVAVVAGLVALAAPAIESVASVFTPAATNTTTLATDTSPEPTPTVAPTSPDAAENPGGLPEGYVYVGHGTWRPAGGAGDCTATAWLWVGSDNDDPAMHAEMMGTPVDMGATTYARGTVNYDTNGKIVSYTVAPGDALFAIGDRLCTEGLSIGTYNNVRGTEIQPDQTLDLNPDPEATWVSIFG